MIDFSCIQMLITAFVLCISQNRRSSNIQKPCCKITKLKSKNFIYPGLAYSGFEQPGPGALLLGSLYKTLNLSINFNHLQDLQVWQLLTPLPLLCLPLCLLLPRQLVHLLLLLLLLLRQLVSLPPLLMINEE